MKEKLLRYLPCERDIFFMFLGGILGIVVHAYITGTLFVN